jgi:BASS family bile acid:Na+ symporter
MFAAGLGTTLRSLEAAVTNLKLVAGVLVANLIVVPLAGLGVAELFSLDTAGYVAVVLIASSPGAPFGAKLAMTQRGDVTTGSALQVLMAAIGSVTFPITANWLLEAANVGSVSLPVGDLVKTVVFLQLIPFGIGLAMLYWTPETADEWHPHVLRASSLTFPAVLVLSLLGSWQQLVDSIGSGVMLAGLLLSVIAVAAGILLSSGPMVTRTTVGLLAPMRNAGPVMAAVGIAFDNDPDTLAAVTVVLLTGLIVGLPVASYLAKSRAAPEAVPGEAPAQQTLPRAV